MRALERHTPATYALLRMVTGFLFAFHGAQKVFGWYLPMARPSLLSQIGVGGIIELVCGLAVMVGYQTRWAAFLASGTMAVAYTQFHWRFQLGSRLLPAVNEGEPALLYAFLFLFIACQGGGRAALDPEK
ncbi:MAG TPA: DoxX family protein [Holophagaceae bacterium]|nr:DoxX family protein [Holophagaceae bacterium]